jgi:hypothetical protein
MHPQTAQLSFSFPPPIRVLIFAAPAFQLMALLITKIVAATTFAVTLALAFARPAFAQDVKTAKTAADCAKAGGVWDAATNTCSEKKM